MPWLQDFSLGVAYGPAEVRAQTARPPTRGIDEWLLWDPRSRTHPTRFHRGDERGDHRRRARPRPGAARRRHGPVGDPLRRAGGAPPGARHRVSRTGATWAAVPEAASRTTSARATPRGQGDLRRRGEAVARRRRRPVTPLVLGGDHSIALGTLGGLARSRAGRRPLGRRACRPEHAGHVADGERARDGARRRPRAGRAGVREPGLAAARRRPRARRARGPAHARRGRAAAAARAPASASGRSARSTAAASSALSARRSPTSPGPASSTSRSTSTSSTGRGAGRRHARARGPVLPRGAPRDGAGGRAGLLGLAGGRRGEPDPRRQNETAELAVDLVASALGARIL